jgi:hypothetical protein
MTMPPAARTLFEKRVLDSQKLLTSKKLLRSFYKKRGAQPSCTAWVLATLKGMSQKLVFCANFYRVLHRKRPLGELPEALNSKYE